MESVYVTVAKKGKVFLILDLTIDNKDGSESFQANSFFMKLKDKEGYVYQHSVVTFTLENYFDGTILNKGELISGKVAFEIPKDKITFPPVYSEAVTGGITNLIIL